MIIRVRLRNAAAAAALTKRKFNRLNGWSEVTPRPTPSSPRGADCGRRPPLPIDTDDLCPIDFASFGRSGGGGGVGGWRRSTAARRPNSSRAGWLRSPPSPPLPRSSIASRTPRDDGDGRSQRVQQRSALVRARSTATYCIRPRHERRQRPYPPATLPTALLHSLTTNIAL
uniref:Uncharacterized protein n=1 Tax=Plectus sambesii TaxID=2011161 RepID=A0A914W9I0_9BILA